MEVVLTEILVRMKLTVLAKQIGRSLPGGECWPRPADGFVDFWRSLEPAQDKELICTGVVTSGHLMFVEKTHELWRVRRPDCVVSDDHMRGEFAFPFKQRVKPSPVLMRFLHRQWFDWTQVSQQARMSPEVRRSVYFGDDPEKDGRMAEAAGMLFGHYNPRGEKPVYLPPRSFQFSHWDEVTECVENLGTLPGNASIDELFTPLITRQKAAIN